jgi:predicted nuclease of predicted toxin-antitoxin system
VRVKVDKDLPKAATQLLRERGFDALSVIEQGMGGSKDIALWSAVQSEQRFLVTADKGFGDIRSFPPGTHAGILVLRPDEPGVRPLVELLTDVLKGYDLEDLSGTLAVASPRGIRIRRGPGP